MLRCKLAVLLAAGIGSRLYPLTLKSPKPLIEIQGKPIILHTIDILKQLNVNKIIIVDGYLDSVLRKIVKEHIKKNNIQIDIIFVTNNKYNFTGNVYSLFLAKNFLSERFLLLDADVYFQKSVLEDIITNKVSANIAILFPHKIGITGNVVKVNDQNAIVSIKDSKSIVREEEYYKTANIFLIDDKFIDTLKYYISQERNHGKEFHYDIPILNSAANNEFPLVGKICSHSECFEIDDLSDKAFIDFELLDHDQKYSYVKSMHGGYWKYGVIDHCLLYNVHFPTPAFFSKMTRSVSNIVKTYPSTRKILTKRFSDYIQLPSSQVVIGNGSSEIIKLLMINCSSVLIPLPSFEEYQNSAGIKKCIFYKLNPENNFEFDEDEFTSLIHKNKPDIAIIINPNNPTSTAIARNKILHILEETKKSSTILLIDESFIDFTDNPEDLSLLKYTDQYKNLAILRSIGKTYGIGGIRLGFITSSNTPFLTSLELSLAIWNINGFAEYFIDNISAHHTDYIESCRKVIKDRKELVQALTDNKSIKIFPAQANFILCKSLEKSRTADKICKYLFASQSIYIKDCTGKLLDNANYYFRVSCRTSEENLFLAAEIKKYMEKEI